MKKVPASKKVGNLWSREKLITS